MSYTQDVKKEIVTIEANIDSLKAELYGIIKLKSDFIISNQQVHLEIVTSNLFLARRIVFLCKKTYGITIEILSKERTKLDYKKLFYLLIKDKAHEMLLDLDLIDQDMNFKDEISVKYKAYKESILRGMFLARGSVNDPNRSNYHLEIVCNYQEECDFLIEILDEHGIEAKIIERKKGMVLYIKKSDQIGDFLKMIGATNMLFYFENERIKRDLNNVVNRVLNCDIANSDRTQASAMRQLKDIKKIEDHLGYGTLSNRLMEVIILRTTYPDSSLSELSELSDETIGRHISKSGINHCFRDLHNIAKTIKD